MHAIGIDLGTTNSCVSVVKNGRPKIILNSNGHRTTPSVIGLWNPKEIVIGSSAAKMAYKYPEGVVKGVKYNIGNKLEMATNKKMLLIDGKKLKYNIKRGGAREYFLPEELSAMMLKALKLYAENYLHEDLSKAVITVPTYFNDSQREATISAGTIAGFKDIKLLNESVAAAVAYGVEHDVSNNKIIFVFDFGGGTLDVSILKYFNNEFDVLAIDGDLHLGGDDITNILFEHVLDKIGNADNTNDRRYRLKLLQICEDVKMSLSNQSECFIDVTGHEDLQITRETFIELTNNLFDKVMSTVKRCLNNAELATNQIHDVVLVGGSSRIPAIQHRLIKFFNKEIKKNINPDEVVARGAAIVAANWNKSGFEHIKLNTMIAHSIGIELYSKDILIIIPRYSKLPIQKSAVLHPGTEECKDVIINIFCGENILATNNIYLGTLNIYNIAIEPISNIREFTVTLEITDNGVLKVTTIDYSKKTNKTTIVLDKTNLSEIETKNCFVRLSTEQIKLF